MILTHPGPCVQIRGNLIRSFHILKLSDSDLSRGESYSAWDFTALQITLQYLNLDETQCDALALAKK